MDDTQFLQSLLDVGGHITLDPNMTYVVSKQENELTALLIGSDTTLDLNGSTIVLSPSVEATSLFGQKDDGSTIENVTITNGTINGNAPLQPDVYSLFTPTIYLARCNYLKITSLVINEPYIYGIYAAGSNGVLNDVDIYDAIGGGVHLNGGRWKIGRVKAVNIAEFDLASGARGNPFIVGLTNSEIGYILCQNAAAGVKLQNSCTNVDIKSIVAIAGPNSIVDYMVKIQGKDPPGNQNRRITIDSIFAHGGPLSGLYIYRSFGVWIRSYHGSNNGNNRSIWENDAKNGADILMIKSDEISINEVRVEGFPIHGFWMQDEVGTFTAEEFISDRSLVNSVVVQEGVAILGGIHIVP